METIMWESPCRPQENVGDAAIRFVVEAFGAERRIVWGSEPGEFRFADGYWCYAISFNGSHWQVRRTATMTPKAKSRAQVRAEIRREQATKEKDA